MSLKPMKSAHQMMPSSACLWFLLVIASCAGTSSRGEKASSLSPPSVCLEDAQRICPADVQAQGHNAMFSCLNDQASKVNARCSEFLESRLGEKPKAAGSRSPKRSGKEYIYIEHGSDLQTLRFRPAVCATKAPIVVYVHGGGWQIGDKDRAALPHRGGPPVMLVRRFPRSGVHAATSSQ